MESKEKTIELIEAALESVRPYLLADGGDVKLVAALGAWLGPIALMCVLFWVAVAGLLLSVVFWISGKKDLPYVPAIAIGLAIFLCWPQGVLVLLESLRAGTS